jgi:hypothetical protein
MGEGIGLILKFRCERQMAPRNKVHPGRQKVKTWKIRIMWNKEGNKHGEKRSGLCSGQKIILVIKSASARTQVPGTYKLTALNIFI